MNFISKKKRNRNCTRNSNLSRYFTSKSIRGNLIPEIRQHEFQGLFGIAVAEINPPAGMYSRTWGYSEHDVAEGIHRPLRASCLTISGLSENVNLTLLALDLMV